MMLPDLDTIILAKLISAGYKFYDHLSIKLSCFITYLDPMVRRNGYCYWRSDLHLNTRRHALQLTKELLIHEGLI